VKHRYTLIMALLVMLVAGSMAIADLRIESVRGYVNGSYWDIRFNTSDDFSTYESIDIFMADGHTQDFADMEKVQTRPLTPGLRDSLKWGYEYSNFYSLSGVAPKNAFSGKKTYALRLNHKNGNNKQSNYHQWDWEVEGEPLTVSRSHSNLGVIGQTHVLQLNFNYDISEVELVSLNDDNVNAIYDATNGKVSWTPTESGAYTFVGQFRKKGSNVNIVTYTWVVYVGSCSEPGKMTFHVEGIPQNSMYRPYFTAEFISDKLNKALIHTNNWGNFFIVESHDPQAYVIKVRDYDSEGKGVIEGYLSTKNGYMLVNDKLEADRYEIPCGIIDSTFIKYEAEEKFMITSTPGKKGAVGEEYVYEPEASKYEASDLVWDFQKLPKDAQMNTNDGRITFTPKEAGDYEFSIICSSISDNITVTQDWTVRVAECAFNGSLVVSLLNSGQNVSPEIHVFDKKGDHVKTEKYPFFGLDKGDYILGIEVPSYSLNDRGQTLLYSGNVYDIKKAETIEIACSDTTEYKWDVTGFLPDGVDVVGKVYDAETQSALHARVEFVCISGIFKGRTASVFSNAVDGYVVALPTGQKWVARAFSAIDSADIGTDKYHLGYYGGADNFFDAEIIEIENNKTIDIGLKPAEDKSASISGVITDEDGNVLEGAAVTAFMIETIKGYEGLRYNAFSTRTDVNGYYKLENLVPGEYVIHAWSGGYLGGYWKGQSEKVVYEWLKAKSVELDKDESVEDVNFSLELRNKNNGSCRVYGNTRNEGGLVKSEDNPHADNAVTGVFITIVDMDGNAVATSYSDYMGDFDIDGLSIGSYDILADKPGYERSSRGFTLDQEGDVEELDMSVQTWQSVSDMYQAGYKIYPNPSDISATITGFVTSDISVDLFDASGVRIGVDYDIAGGKLELSTDKLAVGHYIIVVTDGGNSYRGVLMVK